MARASLDQYSTDINTLVAEARQILAASDLPPPQVERWLPIPDWPGYEISDHGRLRSSRPLRHRIHHEPRLIKPRLNKYGYFQIELYQGKGAKTVLIHRLVALTWHSESFRQGTVVTHLNGVRADNRALNLAWRSASDNSLDKHMHGTMKRGSTNPASKLTETDAATIRTDLRSSRILSTLYTVGTATISKIRRGETWNRTIATDMRELRRHLTLAEQRLGAIRSVLEGDDSPRQRINTALHLLGHTTE